MEIFEEHRKYLSFSWIFSDGSLRYFQFAVLPFGLSSAPYLFTKLLKPMVKKWRMEVKTIVVYLDDGLASAPDYNKAKIVSLQVHSDLLKFGFLPNETKCCWDPVQTITWLGTVINTFDQTISATENRVQSLSNDLFDILKGPHLSLYVKKLASICGKIISLGNCVGNVTRLMTRNIHTVINSTQNWYCQVYLSPDSLAELRFWSRNVIKLNGIPLWPIKHSPTRIVYSDASAAAGRSILEFVGSTFHQNWSEAEMAQSSTFRELLTVSLSLRAFVDKLRSQTVVWFTDNTNVVKIVMSGSKVPILQPIALEIYEMCMLNGISLDVQWIPRELNAQADEISRIVDFDDYTINDEVFYTIDEVWGPHTCDRFACYYNTKLPKFNTRYFQPGSCGVNAFSQNWAHDNNWLCPPVYLTCRVINHMKLCKAKGTLVVPLWKSAHFWPVLSPDGIHWGGFIHDWAILDNHPKLFVRGKAKNSIFGNKPLKFRTVALRVDFSIPNRLIVQNFCTDFEGKCTLCSC